MAESYRKVDSYFDRCAQNYDGITRKNTWVAPEVLYRHIIRYNPAPKKLLDFGVGTGALSLLFNQNTQITGVDVSKKMLRECEEKGAAFPLICADFSKPLEVPEKAFDVVMSCGAMEFVPDLSGVAREAFRALKPGGLIAFTYEPLDECGHGEKTFRHFPETVHRAFSMFAPLPDPEVFTGYHLNGRIPVPYRIFLGKKPANLIA